MKISPEGIDITNRFFLALEHLKKKKRIRGIQTFTRECGINYWNFMTVRNGPDRHVLKPEWIYYLSRYGISSEWIITGNGDVDSNRDTPNKSSDNQYM